MTTRKNLAEKIINTSLRKCFILALVVGLTAGLSIAASASTWALSVSAQSNHSGAVALNGSKLSGNVYIFTSMASQLTNTNPTGITQVCFYLDNTGKHGAATHCETGTPYDYAGSVDGTASSLGKPWNAGSIASGTHTITQLVYRTIGGTETDSATFTVSGGAAVQPVGIAVSPSSAALKTGATQQFGASVTGSSNTGVNWSVNGVAGGNATVGTISTSGLYTAPAAATSVTVTAQSQADTTKTASAAITVSAASAVAVSVSPASATLKTAASQQFSASVSNTSNTAVSWLVNGVAGGNASVGTVSASGVYIAPTAVPSGSISVTAKSAADTTKVATAAVTVVPPPPTGGTYALSVSTQSSRNGAIGLNGATLTGSEYIFTSMASALTNYNPTGITSVCFWLDNTAMSGGAAHCETAVPFDYVSSASAAAGNPWNTTTLANGTHTITQQVTLAAGGTETETASFKVSNAPVPLAVATTSLPNAAVKIAFSTALAAKGGTAPYTWSIIGSMPAGLSFASTGTISGTATATGSFPFTAQVTDNTGATATASETLTVSTATSSSAFFSPSSFINTPLSGSPTVDPNSASMVTNSLVAQASAAHLSNASYGVGLVYSKSSDKVYSIACTTYDSASCLVGHSINFPIPAGAQVPSGTDHNTTFIYTAQDGSPYAGMEVDCWIAQYNAANDTWSCGTASIVHNTGTGWGTCAEGNILSFHCNGGFAAGVDFAAGPIRPEEIAAGSIPHALVVAISNTGSGIVCPATHTDHTGSGIPEGGHFYLPASYNVDAQTWPAWVKTVAHALQNYGGYIVDYGGSFEVKGFTDQNPGSMTWSSVGVALDGYSNLAQIPWNLMQVETMKSCN